MWPAIGIGIVAVTAAWILVRDVGKPVWHVLTPVNVALGVWALVVGDPWSALHPELTRRSAEDLPSVGAAVALGLGVGLLLFVATRAFVAFARRWETFARDARDQYSQLTGFGPWYVAGLALVSALGEELFWRGLIQVDAAGPSGGNWAGPVTAAALAWGSYLVANLASRSISIWAGAAVGGAVWAALPLVTGGIAASISCHAAWTILMLVMPPRIEGGMMHA